MSEGLVKLLAQLIVVIARQAPAHVSDVVKADCDVFQVSRVQVFADLLVFDLIQVLLTVETGQALVSLHGVLQSLLLGRALLCLDGHVSRLIRLLLLKCHLFTIGLRNNLVNFVALVKLLLLCVLCRELALHVSGSFRLVLVEGVSVHWKAIQKFEYRQVTHDEVNLGLLAQINVKTLERGHRREGLHSMLKVFQVHVANVQVCDRLPA